MSKKVEVSEEIMDKILEGDPRCKYSIGTRVEKVYHPDPEQMHPVGAQGIVIGNIYGEDLRTSMNLVIFDHDKDRPTMVVDAKLKEI